MRDDIRYDIGGWLSGSMLSEIQVLRALQRRYPDYSIGRVIGRDEQ